MERKNSIKKNSVIRAIKNIYKFDPQMTLLIGINIPISIVLPMMQAYLPKLLIDFIECDVSVLYLISCIVLYFVGIITVSILQKVILSMIYGKQYNLSIAYQNNIIKKHIHVFYELTEKKEYITKYSLAMNEACSGRCAAEFIWQPIQGLAISIVGIFTAANIMVKISPIIVLILFLNSGISFLYSRYLQKFSDRNKEEKIDIDRKLGYLSTLSTRFEIAKEIKIFQAYPLLDYYFKKYMELLLIWNYKMNKKEFIGKIINAILILIKDGISYFLLICMFLNGKMDAGDLIFYIGTINLLYIWIDGIIGNITDISRQSLRAGYIYDFMDEDYGEIYNRRLKRSSEEPIGIDIDNISYRYGEDSDYAVENISLSIKPGEKVAIVGENGAGKTTLIKILCGLYMPTTGNVKINNECISEYGEYYKFFATVFQDIFLLPVTIKDFIVGNEDFDESLLIDAVEKAELYEKILSLKNGFNTRLGKGIYEDSIDLSGGEKQKLLLARALYKRANCLVLDEPTAELDPIAESNIYRKYNQLFENKTVIFISHRLASTRFCDNIICMKEGKVIEQGTHQELMKYGGYYKELYDAQCKYYAKGGHNSCEKC